MGIADILSAAQSFQLTDEQKAAVKNAVKACEGNKDKIVEEVKKHGINITAEQVDMVIGMVDKL